MNSRRLATALLATTLLGTATLIPPFAATLLPPCAKEDGCGGAVPCVWGSTGCGNGIGTPVLQ